MDHASGRLFERSAAVEAERGFALLRHPEKLAEVLDTLWGKPFPDADRLALPLADGTGNAVPRLVVTRDGRAVTCLARGMHASLPEVPWPEVRGYLDAQEDWLRARRALVRVQQHESGASALSHGLTWGHRMTRAEWDDLRMLAPILGGTLRKGLKNLRGILDSVRRDGKRSLALSEEHVRTFWGIYWGSAHLLTALGGERCFEHDALEAMHMQDVLVAGRAAWVLVNHAERTLEWTRSALRTRDEWTAAVLLPVLPAIAWRFSWHAEEAIARAEEACALLRTKAGFARNAFDNMGKQRRVERDLLNRLPYYAGVRFLDVVDQSSPSLLDAIDKATARIFQGASLEDGAARVGQWAEDSIKAWRPLENAFVEPRTWPRPAGSESRDQIDHHIWWTDMQFGCPWHIGLRRISKLCLFSCAPIDALIPIDALRERWVAPIGVAYLRHILPDVMQDANAPREKRGKPPEPPPPAPSTGRNEPCPCNSGKKFKKCCGAA